MFLNFFFLKFKDFLGSPWDFLGIVSLPFLFAYIPVKDYVLIGILLELVTSDCKTYKSP